MGYCGLTGDLLSECNKTLEAFYPHNKITGRKYLIDKTVSKELFKYILKYKKCTQLFFVTVKYKTIFSSSPTP